MRTVEWQFLGAMVAAIPYPPQDVSGEFDDLALRSFARMPPEGTIQPEWYFFEQEHGHITKLSIAVQGIGTLPREIGYLSRLRFLCLQGNRLQNLPSTFSRLNQLQTLILSSNRLNTLPREMGSLQALQVLHLGTNRLNALPESFGHLRALRDLRLNNNLFTMIPQELSTLHNLERLDVSGNPLERMPDFLKRLPALKGIGISEPIPPASSLVLEFARSREVPPAQRLVDFLISLVREFHEGYPITPDPSVRPLEEMRQFPLRNYMDRLAKMRGREDPNPFLTGPPMDDELREDYSRIEAMLHTENPQALHQGLFELDGIEQRHPRVHVTHFLKSVILRHIHDLGDRTVLQEAVQEILRAIQIAGEGAPSSYYHTLAENVMVGGYFHTSYALFLTLMPINQTDPQLFLIAAYAAAQLLRPFKWLLRTALRLDHDMTLAFLTQKWVQWRFAPLDAWEAYNLTEGEIQQLERDARQLVG